MFAAGASCVDDAALQDCMLVQGPCVGNRDRWSPHCTSIDLCANVCKHATGQLPGNWEQSEEGFLGMGSKGAEMLIRTSELGARLEEFYGSFGFHGKSEFANRIQTGTTTR